MRLPLIAAALAVAVSAPVAALADKPAHAGHGAHAGHLPHAAPGTPPGLAKKPYGMPPGQAKKMWSQGERLPTNYLRDQDYYLSNYSQYQLAAPPPGYRWMHVGSDAYLVQTQTGLITELVRSLFN
ncbi:MAG TPA: RcnB family protein [Phenylobacterium sp.]